MKLRVRASRSIPGFPSRPHRQVVIVIDAVAPFRQIRPLFRGRNKLALTDQQPIVPHTGAKGDVRGQLGAPPVEVNANFDNLSDHLDSGFMIEADLRVGRIGGFADIDLTKFSNARDIEINQFASAASEVELQAVAGTIALFYHFGDSDLLAFDAVAGTRITSTKMQGALQINNLAGGA